MPTDVKKRVLAYLRTQGKIPGKSEREQLRYEYINGGLIDSIGIVKMIMEFEKDLGVTLDPAHMQSARFQTVGGLIEILQKLAAKKRPAR